MTRKLWTRNELIIAINQYCKMPFGKIDHRNPEIIDLAGILGRTPSAVSWKLSNFASLDPSLQARGISGAKNCSKMDRKIWNEFFENWEELGFESEKLIAEYKDEPIEKSAEIFVDDLPREGKDREAIVKIRVNQNFFRKNILSAYSFKCCITGISVPDLLIASHIKPWAKDIKNRLNPRNGLCLNALHDKAFDKGWISLSDEYKLLVSNKLKDAMPKNIFEQYFYSYENKPIELPKRFLPDLDFLAYHRKGTFLDVINAD
jgi:putative restriction endonuclease